MNISSNRNGNAAMASPSPSSSTSSRPPRDGSRSPHRNSPSAGAAGSNRSSLDLNRSCPSAGAKTAQAGGADRPSSALDMSRPASAWSLDGSNAGTPGKNSSSSLHQNNQDRYEI